MVEKARAMDRKMAGVCDESRKAIEAARQSSAGKAGLADLEVGQRVFVFAIYSVST